MSQPTLPPALRARILADAAKTPRAGDETLRMALLVLASALWIAFRAFTEGQRADWPSLPTSATWLPLADAIATAAIVAALSLARGRSMVGPSARWLWLAALAPLFISGTVLFFTVPSPASDAAAFAAFGGHDVSAIITCETEAMITGVPVTLLLVLAQRRIIVASPGLVGAAAGIAAGAWAQVILHRGCPMTGAAHVLLGHAAPTLPLALLGALLAWMLERHRLRPRNRPPA